MIKKVKLAGTGIILAAVITIAAYAGLFFRVDQWAADGLFQQAQPTSGRIMVVGIDKKALEVLKVENLQ